MARNALTIREMGEHTCWLLIQQSMGMKDAKGLSDFMSGRVAVLLFARPSLPERLCATAAVRQMGGSTIYQGIDGGQWRQDVDSFQSHLFPILGYYLDCLYIRGLRSSQAEQPGAGTNFPIISIGCEDGHPVHVLADLACMLRVKKNLQDVRAAWIGAVNGTLYSFIEASVWFPFELTVALPPEEAPAISKYIDILGAPVNIAASPGEAINGANFVLAGRREENGCDRTWTITSELMSRAAPDARLLLSATPVRAIPISPEIFDGKRAMLVRQAEYRLCVHKRILHWVFEED